MPASAPPKTASTGESIWLATSVGRRGVVAPRADDRPVEPDDAGQPEAQGPGQERHPAAHAEADREDRGRRRAIAVLGPQGRDTRPDVRGDPAPRRRADVGRVVEVLAAPGVARGPAEVVDGQGVDAALREAQGQLLVERMEAADVGQDHDAGAGRFGRSRPEGGQAVAVGGRQGQPFGVERAARDRWDGRSAVEIEAHRSRSLRWGLGQCGTVRRRANQKYRVRLGVVMHIVERTDHS